MPRLKEIALFAILVSSTVSVTGLLYVSWLNVEIMTAAENVDVTIESIRITRDRDGNNAMVHVTFKMENPSSVSLTLYGIEYRLFSDDKYVWTGYEYPDPTDLGPKTTITIFGEVWFPLDKIPPDESGRWQVTGTARLASGLTGGFDVRFEGSTTNIDR
ncbi:MAG: hypothetical protein ACE5KG_02745 [Nitrososphaerales archaeon]